MNYYIKTDSTGTALAFMHTISDPPEGWVQVADASAALGSTTRWRLVDGVLVDTGQPFFPPQPYLTWDTATFTWVDLRTQAQKTNAQWDLVRAERNRLLLDSDWTQMPDVTISNKAAWATYRQQLRDVTDQPDPFNITWPVRP